MIDSSCMYLCVKGLGKELVLQAEWTAKCKGSKMEIRSGIQETKRRALCLEGKERRK